MQNKVIIMDIIMQNKVIIMDIIMQNNVIIVDIIMENGLVRYVCDIAINLIIKHNVS